MSERGFFCARVVFRKGSPRRAQRAQRKDEEIFPLFSLILYESRGRGQRNGGRDRIDS